MTLSIFEQIGQEHAQRLQSIALHSDGTAIIPRVEALRAEWEALQGNESAETLMDLMHRSQRVFMIDAAGQNNNAALLQQIDELCPKTWKDEPYLPFQGKQKKVAQQLVNSTELQPGETLFLDSSMSSRGVSEQVFEHCLQNNIYPYLDVQDRDFLRVLMGACTPEEAANVGRLKGEKRTNHDRLEGHKLLFTVQEYPLSEAVSKAVPADSIAEASKAYGAEIAKSREATQEFGTRYCLTFIPTQEEAKHDEMDYEEYLKLFFELCDQPWDEIKTAQANLIQAFNRCEGFRATNDDGTDVRMSIKDFTFANSVIARNLPGSEIFSAPEIDSVNGTVVAKGNFKAPGTSGVIKNITLTFKDGYITDYHADENQEALKKYFDRHPDNMRVGELGIGTNPWLDKHVCNGLLVEKINGSFHLALGHAYLDGYLGEDVKMNNGSRDTKDHWDMTTMLKGKQGEMFLTDEKGVEHLVQKDGEWLAVPALGITQESADILNKGWQALREAGKPIPKDWEKLLDERYGALGQTQTTGR